MSSKVKVDNGLSPLSSSLLGRGGSSPGGCDRGERRRDGGRGRGLRARDVTGRGLDSLQGRIGRKERKACAKVFLTFLLLNYQ